MRIQAAEEADLRTITHHVRFLEATARRHHLSQDGDAIVFNGRSGDRYRLVVMLGGRPMLVFPETDLDHRISRYLRVSSVAPLG